MSSVVDTQLSQDSNVSTREFFDRYFVDSISYPSNQVDAVVGFFNKRGFDKQASISIATVLLQQSKIDNVNVFALLEDLKGFDKVKLTELTTAILNANRSKISKLGYKTVPAVNLLESRNIIE